MNISAKRWTVVGIWLGILCRRISWCIRCDSANIFLHTPPQGRCRNIHWFISKSWRFQTKLKSFGEQLKPSVVQHSWASATSLEMVQQWSQVSVIVEGWSGLASIHRLHLFSKKKTFPTSVQLSAQLRLPRLTNKFADFEEIICLKRGAGQSIRFIWNYIKFEFLLHKNS